MHILFSLLSALLLAGCGTTSLVSDPARNQIKSVSIGLVSKPPAMFYLGPGDGAGLMFGAIGGALASGPIERSRLSFQGFIEKNNISIERLAQQEVEASIRASGKLAIQPPDKAGQGQVSIKIIQYGFGVPHLLSAYVVPVIGIQCDVTDASGKMVWSASERILTLGNPVEEIKPEQMRDDPKLIEAKWRAALKYLADNIIKTF
jgi:hypothetical protein